MSDSKVWFGCLGVGIVW